MDAVLRDANNYGNVLLLLVEDVSRVQEVLFDGRKLIDFPFEAA